MNHPSPLSILKFLVLGILFFVAKPSQAQLVYIPDATFRGYISSLSLSAMVGDSLDPSDAVIQSITIINNLSPGIQDLTGIEYFASLTRLEINNGAGLNILNALPSTLDTLLIQFAGINSLPNLPPGLKWLGCAFLPNLINFNGGFPSTLENISISDCQALLQIPFLPTGLNYLNVFNCQQLTQLPPLPNNLFGLQIDFTPVSINSLPSQLNYFSAAGCNLTFLPALPPTLVSLVINNNNIICFPAFPNGMASLVAINNPVSCLPNIPTNPAFTSDIGTTVCAFPPNLVSNYRTCDNQPCFGFINAATLAGGPYTYLWNDGSTASSISNLCEGTYTLTVTNSNSCAFSDSLHIALYPTPAMSVVTTNISCNGLSDGSISITSSAFQPTYSIDSGITTQLSNLFLNLPAGNYNVVVVDTSDCWATENVNITSPASLSIQTSIANICGGNPGNIQATAIGGTPPYQYSLDGGITFQFTNLFTVSSPGTYLVLVTDANACTATTSVTINSFPSPVISLPPDAVVCAGTLVQLCANGGLFSYGWSTGDITQCIIATSSGLYSCYIIDSNGCTAADTMMVIYSPGITSVIFDSITLPGCGQCDGIVAATVNGGLPIATYQWIPGNVTTSFNTAICENQDYKLVLTDIAGCIDSAELNLSCHAVWPGDANNDGTADNIDLLSIGIGYGTTGPDRFNASIQWQAEFGSSWDDTLLTGVNYKHIDCNGDGIIEDADTTAIIQNFGLTHAPRPADAVNTLTDPELYFFLPADSTSADTTIYIPIMLGTQAIPADSIYGIAFTVNYNPALVKADSVVLNFNNCWMGSIGNNLLGIGVNDAANGKLYAAITRTSHTDTSGYGEIASMGIVTVDNISARLMGSFSDTMLFTFSDVIIITYDQQYKPVNITNDTLIINDNTVGISNNTGNVFISAYPNPATNYLIVDVDTDSKIKLISLISVLNQEIIIPIESINQRSVLDISNVPAGIYLLNVNTENGTAINKISIIKN